MKLASRCLLVAIIAASLVACSNFRFPGVHRINIQQGHIITEDMVQQLQEGQTKRQVRFVLGNTLLPNTFDDDRWDYYYSLKRGSDGRFTRHLLTVYFEDEKLARWEGDYLRRTTPASTERVDRYLDDTELNTPLPTNLERPRLPEEEE